MLLYLLKIEESAEIIPLYFSQRNPTRARGFLRLEGKKI